MIYVTGDTHNTKDIFRLASTGWAEGAGLTRDDFLVILGDFGVLWRDKETRTERILLQWLKSKPWTTLFIDGNHENFSRLNALERAEIGGGEVGVVDEHIYHLRRGEAYLFGGKKIFTFGGARSLDRILRRKGVNWWPEERASEEEEIRGWETIERHGGEFDYVFTHTCPQHVRYRMRHLARRKINYTDPTEVLLDRYHARLCFRRWFFGHFHWDYHIDAKYTAVYREVHELSEDG